MNCGIYLFRTDECANKSLTKFVISVSAKTIQFGLQILDFLIEYSFLDILDWISAGCLDNWIKIIGAII